jgi:hypothetical protein
MTSIRATIPGVPYARNETRGNLSAPSEWIQAVINHTADLPKIREACQLRIAYLLPRAHIPKD